MWLGFERPTKLYLGSDNGQLYALSEATGAILWQTSAGVPIEAPEEEYGYLRPLTGLGAGAGLLVVPATDTLIAYGN